jgi:mono/diheme cytochrome c family protein
MVIPGLMLAWLLLLPFVDRRRERHPLRRPLVTGGFAMLLTLVGTLTWLGLQDTPAHADPAAWGPVSLGGRTIAAEQQCVRCHQEGGPASELDRIRLRRDPDWVVSHVRDPEVVGPGVRQPPEGAPSDLAGRAVVAYMRKLRLGSQPPRVNAGVALAAQVFATRCARCHAIDGEGDPVTGGDLSRVGREHDARWLRAWISDPSAIDPTAEMPAFGDTLQPEAMTAIVWYLAERK